MAVLIIILSILVLIFFISSRGQKNECRRLDAELNELKRKLTDITDREEALKNKEAAFDERMDKEIKAVNSKLKKAWEIVDEKERTYRERIHKEYEKLIAEKTVSFPWLAEMASDFYSIFINEKRCIVTNVKELKTELKKLKKENRLLAYNLGYIKKLLPEIDETLENDVTADEKIEYLTEEEYLKLTNSEKNQLALNRYKANRRGKHNIGRDFEMYNGFLYAKNGFKVQYFGIEEKLHDLGRDLIVEDEESIFIVQCKFWSKSKVIHEKHLCQLYGTTIKYKMEIQTTKTVIPVFICHNELSDTAREFARELGIEVHENVELADYPMIKCNIQEGIYHLPFDQSYDILKMTNCELVDTVEKAEELHCRRAYKWYGN